MAYMDEVRITELAKDCLWLCIFYQLLKCWSQQLMHWDTFKQDNYSTVGGDGGCSVSEVRAQFASLAGSAFLYEFEPKRSKNTHRQLGVKRV